jgi:hypothetical protein
MIICILYTNGKTKWENLEEKENVDFLIEDDTDIELIEVFDDDNNFINVVSKEQALARIDRITNSFTDVFAQRPWN